MKRASEWGLLALTLATVAGFGRLFTDGFFWELALVAVYAHVAAALCRQRGLGVTVSSVVVVAGLLPVLTCMFFWEESTLGLPGPAALDAARASLDEAWAVFSDVQAPTAPLVGFLLTSAVALTVAAFLADWAAFRLWSPYEAVVPTATLFVFAALLGRDGQVVAGALYVGAMLLFLLLHRVERLEGAAWVGRPADARSSLVGHGVALAAAAVVLGALVAPATPGADSAPVIDYRGGGGEDGDRVTVSPLVDIQRRLVEQDDTIVFRVEADQPEYWRLTSLDIYDGEIWKSKGRYKGAGTELPEAAESEAPRQLVRQDYTIEALAALWLPAAYEPRTLDSEVDVRYEARSGTLIVETDVDSSDGYSYVVESAVPSFTPDELRSAPAPSAEILERYAPEPEGLSTFALDWAAGATAGTTTDYDAVLAMQDAFQAFDYSLEVPRGHSSSAIDDFLYAEEGYCEQFAGTFAALARALGIPARVAVGFTPGTQDGTGAYVVRGRYAHAWPEVWFEGYGWVPFEPTPGRGMPGAEPWTGVQPAQADEAAVPSSDTSAAPGTSASTTPPSTAPLPLTDLETSPESGTGVADADAGGETPAVVRLALGVLAVALVYLLVVPSWLALRRSRRRAAAQEPGDRVLLAWDEALDALETPRRPDETYLEYATRAASRLPEQAGALQVLADRATAADYWDVDELAAADAEDASHAVVAQVTGRRGTRARVLRELDARRLLPRRRR